MSTYQEAKDFYDAFIGRTWNYPQDVRLGIVGSAYEEWSYDCSNSDPSKLKSNFISGLKECANLLEKDGGYQGKKNAIAIREILEELCEKVDESDIDKHYNESLKFSHTDTNIPSKQTIRELVDRIANLQSEAKRDAKQKGDENLAFGAYHTLESYKMPLYYAWEAYNYGHHKELSDIKGDPLMSFSIFENDKVAITKQLIYLLETNRSPICKQTLYSSLSEDLIALYSTYVNDLIDGEID